MGQRPAYNKVIKSKGAIRMAHKELCMVLKQLSEYQLKQIRQTVMRFLLLNQELAEIEPDTCPCCGDQNTVFIRKGIQGEKQWSQCKSCGKKFTYDSKQLTAHSHQPMESCSLLLTLLVWLIFEAGELWQISRAYGSFNLSAPPAKL